ncbi:MAG: MFS transporter [Salinirussus sp.]
MLSPTRQSLADVRADPRTGVLVVVAAGWTLSLGVRLAYPALLPRIRVWFGLDLATAGLLLTVLWLCYAIGQVPGGLLADRLGERAVLAASPVFGGICLAAVALAPTATIVFLGTAAFGLATALYAVPRVTVLSELYPENLGSALGVSMAAGDVGNTTFPPIAAGIAALLAWQAGLGAWVPLLLAVGLLLWWLVPTGDRSSGPSAVSAAGLQRLAAELRRRPILHTWAIIILIEIVWHAFAGFYPTYLVEVKGLSPTVAAMVFGAFFALGGVVRLLAGRAYDRVGVRRSMPAFVGLATAGMLALPVVEGLPWLVGVTVLLSFVLGLFTITLAHLTTTLATEVRGSGLGLIRTVYIGIGAVSPVGVGVIADAGRFDTVFWLLGAVLVAAGALTLVLPPDQ